MDQTDSSYFEHRAEQERAAADGAADERARRSHAALAERLLEAAKDGVESPSSDEAASSALTPDLKIIPPQRG